jgi:glycosyltransferase involved in cell wall biosynthesis
MLLQAFAGFRKVHDWDLLIAGRGPKEAELRKLAQNLGLADRVHFLGFREDIMRYHAGASLFALSSDVESFGNVILEALSFGVPVVATDCGGPREVLGDNAFGWLTPPGDAKAFERAMLDAASAAPAPDKLKSRSRQFSLGGTADAYEKLCMDLVTQP